MANKMDIIKNLKFQILACFTVSLMTMVSASALELTIADAEQVAVQNDPKIREYQARSESYMEESVAEASWPDPKLKFGTANVPISGFDFKKEPMTQIILGFQQVIPPGDIRNQKKEKRLLQAEVQRAKSMARALLVLQNLRKAWMEAYYYQQALALISESEEVFDQLVKITQYQYRAGRSQQQDVVRAQLELSILKDKENFFRQQFAASLASLEKWTGASVRKHTLSPLFPDLPPLPNIDALRENVEFHPAMSIQKALLGEARKDVAIVKQTYKPTWMIDVSYGFRQGETALGGDQFENRADFLSAMVTMDLPFFTSKRQDKRLNAKGQKVNAASDAIDSQRRDLEMLLETAYSNWENLGERLEYYKTTVLPQASQFAEISRKSYQSQVSDFSELSRARLRELDMKLQALRIRVERAKSHYDLRFIAGET